MQLLRPFLTNAILNTVSLKNDIILNSTWKLYPFSQHASLVPSHLPGSRQLRGRADVQSLYLPSLSRSVSISSLSSGMNLFRSALQIGKPSLTFCRAYGRVQWISRLSSSLWLPSLCSCFISSSTQSGSLRWRVAQRHVSAQLLRKELAWMSMSSRPSITQSLKCHSSWRLKPTNRSFSFAGPMRGLGTGRSEQIELLLTDQRNKSISKQ